MASWPNSYDLLSASLAACTAMTIRLHARHKNYRLSHVEVAVSYHHADDNSRGSFQRVITLRGSLDNNQRAQLLRGAEQLPGRDVQPAPGMPTPAAPPDPEQQRIAQEREAARTSLSFRDHQYKADCYGGRTGSTAGLRRQVAPVVAALDDLTRRIKARFLNGTVDGGRRAPRGRSGPGGRCQAPGSSGQEPAAEPGIPPQTRRSWAASPRYGSALRASTVIIHDEHDRFGVQHRRWLRTKVGRVRLQPHVHLLIC